MTVATVRGRVTFVAFVAMLLTLSAGAIVLLALLRQSLVNEIDRTITNRAFDVAAEIDVRNELDSAGFPNDPETFVGVIEQDADGPILEIHNDDQPSALELLSYVDGGVTGQKSFEFGKPGRASIQSISLTEGADNLRMVFAQVSTGDEIVVVARTLDGVDRTVGQVRATALATVPLLALLVSVLVYALTGRALRPVDRMRTEVDAITAGDLTRRVKGSRRADEVSRLALTMNSMLERLESAQDRQRRFASDAAHELRSPLASIRAQLDVDLAHPDIARWDHTVAHVRNEVERMQHMVDDLLIMARSEDGSHDLASRELVDLDDIVIAVVARLRPTSSVDIDTSGVSAATVRGIPGHLRRTVNNLLVNALRHAENTVSVSLTTEDNQAVVMVDDDGDGVRPEDRERIFERFVRLDEARSRDAGGSGLGLALGREIAVAHGGSLSASNNDAGGARFTLKLPSA